MKLLFSIELKFQTDLDNGHLSDDLRSKFEENRGITLSQNTTISPEKEYSKWLINDEVNNEIYAVKKDDGKLDIYNTTHADRVSFFDLSQLDDDQIDLLEGALLIAKDVYPDLDISVYLQKLDQMAEDLQTRIGREWNTSKQIDHLNRYLFEEQGFASSSENDYYNPRNSYLNDVLERKLGIPITLSIVYMEIGKRIGLSLVGINFPGHFIVKLRGLETFIDPFEGGQILSDETLSERLAQMYHEPFSMQTQSLSESTNKQILARMLRNLKQIHFKQREHEKAVRAGEKITWLEPQSAQEHRDLGYLYYQVNAYTKSLVAFRTYLCLSNEPPDQQEIIQNIRILTKRIAMLN